MLSQASHRFVMRNALTLGDLLSALSHLGLKPLIVLNVGFKRSVNHPVSDRSIAAAMRPKASMVCESARIE